MLRELYDLWNRRGGRDEYMGTLVNAWIAEGGCAIGVHAGRSYVDVGTVRGYREAIVLLGGEDAGERQASGPSAPVARAG